MKNRKKCPFNMEPCMEDDCVLFACDIQQCEFKDLSAFIGECFTELFEMIETNKGKVDD